MIFLLRSIELGFKEIKCFFRVLESFFFPSMCPLLANYTRTKNSASHQSRGRQPSSAHTVFVYLNKYMNKDALDLYLHFYVRRANRISRRS